MDHQLLDETHDPSRQSFVDEENAPDADFPIQNLPQGIFSTALDQPAQFDRCFPQRLVFEKQAWRQGCLGWDRFRRAAHFCGIEIDIHDAAAAAGLLHFAVFVTSRYKDELALNVSQR